MLAVAQELDPNLKKLTKIAKRLILAQDTTATAKNAAAVYLESQKQKDSLNIMKLGGWENKIFHKKILKIYLRTKFCL